MPLGKRELARIERRLITSLTEACETAKAEIKGFAWLTHIADLNAVAETLKVIWVFETLADRKVAQVDAKSRIFELFYFPFKIITLFFTMIQFKYIVVAYCSITK